MSAISARLRACFAATVPDLDANLVEKLIAELISTTPEKPTPALLASRDQFTEHVVHIAQNADLYNTYLKVVLASREAETETDPLAIAASAAISILNAAWLAGHCPSPFAMHTDFAGVLIPHAILDEAQIHGCILTCASLSSASLIETSLHASQVQNVRINHAIIPDVTLELPSNTRSLRRNFACPCEGWHSTSPTNYIAIWNPSQFVIYDCLHRELKPFIVYENQITGLVWHPNGRNFFDVNSQELRCWQVELSQSTQIQGKFTAKYRIPCSLTPPHWEATRLVQHNPKFPLLAVLADHRGEERTTNLLIIDLESKTENENARVCMALALPPLRNPFMFEWSPDGRYLGGLVTVDRKSYVHVWRVVDRKGLNLDESTSVFGTVATAFAWYQTQTNYILAIAHDQCLCIYEAATDSKVLVWKRILTKSKHDLGLSGVVDLIVWSPNASYLLVGIVGEHILALDPEQSYRVFARVDAILPQGFLRPVFWQLPNQVGLHMLVHYLDDVELSLFGTSKLRLVNVDALIASTTRPTAGMTGSTAVRWSLLRSAYLSTQRVDMWARDGRWTRACLAFSPNGKYLVVGSHTKYNTCHLELWDLTTGICINSIYQARYPRRLLLENGELHSRVEHNLNISLEGRITALQWSSDSGYIAVCLQSADYSSIWAFEALNKLEFASVALVKSRVQHIEWDTELPVIHYASYSCAVRPAVPRLTLHHKICELNLTSRERRYPHPTVVKKRELLSKPEPWQHMVGMRPPWNTSGTWPGLQTIAWTTYDGIMVAPLAMSRSGGNLDMQEEAGPHWLRGPCRLSLSCHHGDIASKAELIWSPNHRYLLTKLHDFTVCLVLRPRWQDIKENLELAEIATPVTYLPSKCGARIGSVVWSPDSTRIAGVYLNNSCTYIQIWNVESGEPTQVLELPVAIHSGGQQQPPPGVSTSTISLVWDRFSSILAYATGSHVLIWRDVKTSLDSDDTRLVLETCIGSFSNLPREITRIELPDHDTNPSLPSDTKSGQKISSPRYSQHCTVA